MAQHETEMLGSKTSRISKLWRTWHFSLRTLAGKLRELLGGYGVNLEEGTGFGSDRQQWELYTRELPMGDQEKKCKQSEIYDTDKWHDALEDIKADWDWENNLDLPAKSRVADRVYLEETGLPEQVYDIMNCGPKHRFAVWNGKRPLIVSNCVQGISRDILCHAMKCLREYRMPRFLSEIGSVQKHLHLRKGEGVACEGSDAECAG
jgi:hypothetical protein